MFYLQLCEGGPVTDLVRGLKEANRRMQEEHIAYILKGIVKVGTQQLYIFYLLIALHVHTSTDGSGNSRISAVLQSPVLSLTF
jgi:hypothetical protein